MPRTILPTRHPDLVANADLIVSCNGCGAPAYRRRDDAPDPTQAYVATGLQLWDLRMSPNGTQVFVIKLCRACIEALQEQMFQVLIRYPDTERVKLEARLERASQPCRDGHVDCATTAGGACLDAAMSEVEAREGRQRSWRSLSR